MIFRTVEFEHKYSILSYFLRSYILVSIVKLILVRIRVKDSIVFRSSLLFLIKNDKFL